MGTLKMFSEDMLADEKMSSTLITGPEKSHALDAASLLGGNEIMVAQLLKDQESRTFTDEEKLVIQWALNLLWKDEGFSQPVNGVAAQTYFSAMFLPEVKRELPRLLANCLLYCVRNETTLLWTSPDQPSYRILVLDTIRSLHAQATLATIGDEKIPCTKLAMLYTKKGDQAIQPRM